VKKSKGMPFKYGGTVSSNSFTNRTKELNKLTNNLTSGINTIIISPRRWGKSSLVEKAMQRVITKKQNHKVVMIDLFSVSSINEFLEVYTREVVKASSSKWEEWLTVGKDFFKQVIPKFSFQADPTSDFGVSFDWEESEKYADEILDLPERIAKKKKVKFIICLDEFQYLSDLDGYKKFEKKMRAVWQRQKNVSYCLYGSKRHLMQQMFNTSRKPFYRFGDIMFLQKIETKEWIKFIKAKFKQSSKEITDEAAGLIPNLMRNHSWYVQQLSHYLWESVDKKATAKDVATALHRLIETNTPLYIMGAENLSNTQLNLLKAIAQGEKQLTSKRVMAQYDIGTPQNVVKNKRTLEKKDIILKNEDGYELADPTFAIWFLKVYFNEDVI